MRKRVVLILFALTLLIAVVEAHAQTVNWTQVLATSIKWTDGTSVTGTLCLTPTDANDNPISFRVGGGGQIVSKPACQTVTSGALVGSLQVPNPCTTAPANIRYRIEVSDTVGNHLKYTKVSWCSTLLNPNFNFDTFVPTTINLPPSGASVNTLGVQHLTVLGDCTGCASLSGFHSFYSINIPKPELADSGLIQAESDLFHYQIVGITCTTDQGSATVNLEVRSTPNLTGVPVLNTPLVCMAAGITAGDMTPVVVPVGYAVTVMISNVAGTPNILRLHVQTTY